MTDALAVAHQYYDAIHAGDFDALFDVLSEDCIIEYYGPKEIPFAGIFKGKEKCKIFFGHVADDVVIKDFRQVEFIASDNLVAVTGHLTLEFNETKRIYDSEYAHVLTIQDGKVARFRDFQDSAKAAYVCADMDTPER
ncbi:MAG: nuclear transport factor 2 family protein [Pseudomonadota bacterium]